MTTEMEGRERMVEHGQLSNGIRIVLEEMATCRSVSFGIWVKTGSRNELPTNNGISHFIEHMLFKGTERFSAKEIAEVFDGIGGNVNAFTSKEYTCFYAKVLDEHVPIAVDVLADMFYRSKLDDEELAKEKNVILEEISMYEDTPDDIVHDMIAKAAYGEHSLGMPILGTAPNLSAMTSDDLRRYIDGHYGNEAVVVSVAGNIGDSTTEMFEQYFGRKELPKRSVQADAVTAPDFVAGHSYLRKKTEQNHLCIAMPGCSQDDPLLYAMILLNNAVGGGMSSRLFQEVREKRGLAYSVYSGTDTFADTGAFSVYAGCQPDNLGEVAAVVREVLTDVAEHGITDAECARAKGSLRGGLVLGLEDTGARMHRIGRSELSYGQHWSITETLERISSVSTEEVRSVAADLLHRPFAVAVAGPYRRTRDVPASVRELVS